MRGLRLLAVLSAGLAGPVPAVAQFVPPPPPPPVYNPYNQSQRPLGGMRCATPAGVCMMGAPGQLGTRCTCVTGSGPVPGQIIQ